MFHFITNGMNLYCYIITSSCDHCYFVLLFWYFHISLPVFLIMSEFIPLYRCIRNCTTSPPLVEIYTSLQYFNNDAIDISVHIFICFPMIYFLKCFNSNRIFYRKNISNSYFYKTEADYKNYK